MSKLNELALAVVAGLLTPAFTLGDEPAKGASAGQGRYAAVNGLKMYYEIHGTGRPLVYLHGSFGWAAVPPALLEGRQVIAVELQAHGHTADIDRPMTYDNMADDVVALLKHLKIEQADFFGYSMGGVIGLSIAIRHPTFVRTLAVYGSHAGNIAECYEPESLKHIKALSSDFAPPILKDAYDKRSPDPRWPTLVAKVKKMSLEFKGFAARDLRSIQAPVLISLGDRDGVRLEHAIEMYRAIPRAQLAVFPRADHILPFTAPERMLPTMVAFFNAPLPGSN